MSRYFILSSLLLAALFSVFFSRRLKDRSDSLKTLYFFLFVFAAALAAQLWIGPLGPVFLRLDLVLLICLSLVFFIAAEAFSRPASFFSPFPKKEKGLFIGLFFWIILLLLIVSAATGLSNHTF